MRALSDAEYAEITKYDEAEAAAFPACDYDHCFNIGLLGDSGVGKSNLLSRLVNNKFLPDSKPTVGREYGSTTVHVDGKKIIAQIWDWGGQEQYRSLVPRHLRGLVGALIVYDITREDTFSSVNGWLDDVRTHACRNAIVMLVGNKCDLHQLRSVSQDKVQGLCAERALHAIETSALDDTNVEAALMQLLKEMCMFIKLNLQCA